MSSPNTNELKRLADESRKEILIMLEAAGSGHPGGSLSVIDILTALYHTQMRHDTKDPLSPDRDRLVLSKGHGVPALYAVLAQKGFLPKDELVSLRKTGSRLQGHPDRVKLPLMEASTGSLGQGLSIAQGLALGIKLAKKQSRVFCVLGDGEIQEGQIWEAAMSAPKFELDNLIVILDNNHGQIDGTVEEVMDIRPINDKWEAFGWETQSINGHSMDEIVASLEKATSSSGKPQFIHADTVKGKGVSFMEGNIGWHGVTPDKAQLEQALGEINARLNV